ncbi:MAG TPA: Mo-dependent nitrogenase C-terminal domain-containing protein [Oscillatoriaceae cyanobacterium M33_DOE_052]|uniref:Nitrogenase n=1 Tax=Planktothricoides sp. SpSt-374 TaxID=2282167 RepID=A0A7C3ZM15_9CYAN|nr:Mo-dependent nitrogenase C-terminal domain-containing protein [Oscillatoriaceae cyanobacterium M33_DOE_052]
MSVSDDTIKYLAVASWVEVKEIDSDRDFATPVNQTQKRFRLDLLYPLRQWLNQIDVRHPKLAHSVCKLIPAQCPFERDINLFGRTLFHIPPMCKLNPLYEEVVMLRFRALCYLADECGEDITPYC